MGAALKQQKQVAIDHVARLGILLRKPKRIKILVGGRASTKSTFVSDVALARVAKGQTVCCGREYQNTIDDSVHAMLKEEIERLEAPGFTIQASEIQHASGGRTFYRGLARNITSLKALICDMLWIEEGESLSAETLRVLTASVRASALEQKRALKEEREIQAREIWITMNRRSSKDPIAKQYLARAEAELLRTGFYEDDLVMIIEINYDENPRFIGSGLEAERADDEANLSTAAYDHKWKGKYSDTVENAIIDPEWFDACIDAHIKLNFKPEGLEVLTFDPFDGGDDAAAWLYRHGNVFLAGDELKEGRVNDVCDWALDQAIQRKPDVFIWDAGGMGAGLKRQITDALGPKKISIQSFEGQSAVHNPDGTYEPTPGMVLKEKQNRQVFFNRRAQRYWGLRDRIFRTYLAVRDGKYTDPSQLISFSSEMKILPILRTELGRIPRKANGQGKIQIMSKDEMKREGIDSPNLGDCAMMAEDAESPIVQTKPINFSGWQ